MLSRIGFIALLRRSARHSCIREGRRAARRRSVTTPPSPFPPGLGPPSPLPPSPAPTHHMTLRSNPRRPPCWPFLTRTLKRYLVARFRGQVEPLLSDATDSPPKRSSPGGSH
jgi:hypothetical protein